MFGMQGMGMMGMGGMKPPPPPPRNGMQGMNGMKPPPPPPGSNEAQGTRGGQKAKDMQRRQEIFSDGKVTSEERQELHQMMQRKMQHMSRFNGMGGGMGMMGMQGMGMQGMGMQGMGMQGMGMQGMFFG